jgi:hypothetical protein
VAIDPGARASGRDLLLTLAVALWLGTGACGGAGATGPGPATAPTAGGPAAAPADLAGTRARAAAAFAPGDGPAAARPAAARPPAAGPVTPEPGAPPEAERPRRTVKFGQQVWWKAEAPEVGSTSEAVETVCARALDRARALAAREVALAAGVMIHSVDIDVQQLRGRDSRSLYESLSEIATGAKLLDERQVVRTPSLGQGQMSCHVRGEFLVVPLSPVRHCKLEAVLHRDAQGKRVASRGLRRNSTFNLRERERVEIGLKLTRPAGDQRPIAAFLYSIDDRGKIYPIFPNAEYPKLTLASDQELRIPSAEQQQHGIQIEARLPEGLDESVEGFLVLALPGPVRPEDLATGEARDSRVAIGRLYRAALRAAKDPSELCWDYVLYRIVK